MPSNQEFFSTVTHHTSHLFDANKMASCIRICILLHAGLPQPPPLSRRNPVLILRLSIQRERVPCCRSWLHQYRRSCSPVLTLLVFSAHSGRSVYPHSLRYCRSLLSTRLPSHVGFPILWMSVSNSCATDYMSNPTFPMYTHGPAEEYEGQKHVHVANPCGRKTKY